VSEEELDLVPLVHQHDARDPPLVCVRVPAVYERAEHGAAAVVELLPQLLWANAEERGDGVWGGGTARLGELSLAEAEELFAGKVETCGSEQHGRGYAPFRAGARESGAAPHRARAEVRF